MPPRNRRWRFHGLKRPKIRQDWNKYNFYNLSRLTRPGTASRTYFQQKWTAKATTRAYHGEHVNEKQWERMFSKITPAVVPMNPEYLAENDGSEHASGRGSGKELAPYERKKPARTTPYMQMVYYPTERRLDTAIFRALFASSARQARQHVTHGHVKVNGKRMIYPGYLLNPGDLFSINPIRVLKTTGHFMQPAGKPRKGKNAIAGTSPITTAPVPDPSIDNEEVAQEPEDEPLTEEELSIPTSDTALAQTKQSLLKLREQATDLIENPPKGSKPSARQKQDIRAFKKTLKQSLSRAAKITPSTLDDLEAEYQALSSRVTAAGTEETPTASEEAVKASVANPPPSSPPKPGTTTPPAPSAGNDDISSPEDAISLQSDADPSRRWRPKDYMSAFAFIPRYLEVNQSICSAVYLRHPVCKPGFAEVPTPFHPETGMLAFNWYLRRR